MTSSWEQFEEFVRTEMRKVYSETTIDHAMNPRNVGAMENADGFAQVTGPCGDTMEIWLAVKDDTVNSATFMTDGCGSTIAAGSMITEMARGKKIAQAQRISGPDVLKALDGLPEENEHCALLAASTLRAAIRDYLALKKEPWKRSYRKR